MYKGLVPWASVLFSLVEYTVTVCRSTTAKPRPNQCIGCSVVTDRRPRDKVDTNV
jgi:hypothetical protein